MPFKQKLWMACVAAALLLIAMRVSPTTGPMLAFITVVTTVGLWLLGFTRTPAIVRQARRAAGLRPRGSAEAHPQVPDRQFKVRVNRAGWAVSYLLCALGVGGGVWFGVLGVTDPKLGNDILVLGLVTVCASVLMGYFLWRSARLTIRTGPTGIESDVLFGRRQIAWDDIVIVCKLTDLWHGQVRLGEQYVAYALDGFIKLPPQLENRDELVATLLANAPGSPKMTI